MTAEQFVWAVIAALVMTWDWFFEKWRLLFEWFGKPASNGLLLWALAMVWQAFHSAEQRRRKSVESINQTLNLMFDRLINMDRG